ncbi:MAG: GNAT family N-acetyltransferase [Acidobacteria bacterium]|nr:GNAT family N-acetyltransferase [Acidobacteriota bacterium]
MTVPTSVAVLRQRCGSVKEYARDRIFSVTRSILFETSCDSLDDSASAPAVRFRLAGAADLGALGEKPHEYDVSAKKFGFDRLQGGDSFVVGECDGDVVFYAWLMHDQIDLDQNVLIPTAEHIAYSYRVFTVEKARGRRLCGAYYTWLKRLLQEEGCKRLICRIGAGNRGSIRAHTRAGFEPCGDLWKFVLARHCTYRADRRLREWLGNLCPAEYFSSSGLLLRHNS